jgi:hypothetical protein
MADRFATFTGQGCQLEGWFKGELLHVLAMAQREGAIASFDREVRAGGGRVDLTVKLPTGESARIELKHWLIGVQRRVKYDAPFYFSDPTSVGITGDVRKLLRDAGDVPGFMLMLLTEKPRAEGWQRGLAKFHEKFAPLRLEALTEPAAYPPSYFLAALRVSSPAPTLPAGQGVRGADEPPEYSHPSAP